METVSRLPEEGELVLATVRSITTHGAYVTLDEYEDMNGFLHISEISTGWVKSIERYVRLGQKIVLKVIRVSKQRKEIDLSLRQVTGEERREKLVETKKAEKADSVMKLVESKLNLNEETGKKYRELLMEEFGALYDAVEEVSRKGIKVLQKLNLPQDYASNLETIAKEKIIIPTVKVHGVIELKSDLPDGIDIIKSVLLEAENVRSGGAEIDIKYLGAPRYRIEVKAENYKIAEKALEISTQKVRESIKKKGGSFSFERER
ncbi:MAG: translation initiation factor IF-2 subunit alpha [archaeon]|nr:translation initiation factor IF-2 subunit alpha [archaeon]MCP8319463.1 translation initiation factor IF-2 subunit alpha [archaeon]